MFFKVRRVTTPKSLRQNVRSQEFIKNFSASFGHVIA